MNSFLKFMKFLLVIMPLFFISLAHGKDIVVTSGKTLSPKPDWIGNYDVNLIMENGSILRLDPEIAPVWTIKLKSLLIGDNVTFDLSGKDNSNASAPPTAPRGPDGHAESNGNPGTNGYTGVSGGNTAEVHFDVGLIKIGSLKIVRHSGGGGIGGRGGDGGTGGAGSCFKKGGHGGRPGVGGQGGKGGDVRPIILLYAKSEDTSGIDNLPGISDDRKLGNGGLPGNGGVSHAGSGCAGSGDNYDYTSYNLGPGPTGSDSGKPAIRQK